MSSFQLIQITSTRSSAIKNYNYYFLTKAISSSFALPVWHSFQGFLSAVLILAVENLPNYSAINILIVTQFFYDGWGCWKFTQSFKCWKAPLQSFQWFLSNDALYHNFCLEYNPCRTHFRDYIHLKKLAFLPRESIIYWGYFQKEFETERK